jgi:hypothetical protein
MFYRLTKEERQHFRPYVRGIGIARVAYMEGVRAVQSAHEIMWKEIRKKWPSAINFEHDPKKAWRLEIED